MVSMNSAVIISDGFHERTIQNIRIDHFRWNFETNWIHSFENKFVKMKSESNKAENFTCKHSNRRKFYAWKAYTFICLLEFAHNHAHSVRTVNKFLEFWASQQDHIWLDLKLVFCLYIRKHKHRLFSSVFYSPIDLKQKTSKIPSTQRNN